MFGSIGRSWQLVREAWNVLLKDRSLVLFPILSGICSVLVMATFLVPTLFFLPWKEMAQAGPGHRSIREELDGWRYAVLFLYYLANYFVIVFFNSALVACVRKRFAGETPTLGDGLAFSFANIGRLFLWSLLSATVGTILRSVQERAGWLGRIVISLIGLAWSLATMFVVPVLVYEGVGPIDAVKRSAQAFKRTWGEAVVANAGMGTAFGLLLLGGFMFLIGGMVLAAVAFAGNATAAAIAIGLTLLVSITYCVGLAIVQSALQGIFLTACYQYATTGQVPSAFAPEHVIQAWRPKGR